MQVTVSRPVEGVSLNGDEYLLGDDGYPMIFDNEASARAWLLEQDFSQDDLETLNFNLVEDGK